MSDGLVGNSSSWSITSVGKGGKTSAPGTPSPTGRRLLYGFRVTPEKDVLSVKAENVAPYTLPVEALSYTPDSDTIICKFKNGDKERKIYLNIELEAKELEQLQALRKEVQDRKLEFYPSIITMATRFLSRARGDAKKAIKLMEATQNWRTDYFKSGPVEDNPELVEDLAHGIVYFAGRDRKLRPLIVVRANRIPQQWYKEKRIDKLIRVLIFCMEYMQRYMLIPGRVENNCLIVDLSGLTVAQVPMGALVDVYNVMSHHYIGRVYKFFITNLSSGLKMLAGMAKGILTDRQKQKLVFVDNVKELEPEFAAHQLEVDFGGSRPRITKFYPFPLLPGPFEGGHKAGHNSNAPEGVHEVLTGSGSRGRLWDASKTKEENMGLEYSAKAPEIFERCNITLPPEVAKMREEQAAAQAAREAVLKAAEEAGEAPPPEEPEPQVADGLGEVGVEMLGDEENVPAQDEDVIFDGPVKPKGCFSCRPCFTG